MLTELVENILHSDEFLSVFMAKAYKKINIISKVIVLICSNNKF